MPIRTTSSLKHKYAKILETRKLDYYKKIIGKKDYQPNIEIISVKTQLSKHSKMRRGRKRLPRDENGNILRPKDWVPK